MANIFDSIDARKPNIFDSIDARADDKPTPLPSPKSPLDIEGLNELSFGDAFALARELREATFKWHGGIYTTETKEEAAAQTPEAAKPAAAAPAKAQPTAKATAKATEPFSLEGALQRSGYGQQQTTPLTVPVPSILKRLSAEAPTVEKAIEKQVALLTTYGDGQIAWMFANYNLASPDKRIEMQASESPAGYFYRQFARDYAALDAAGGDLQRDMRVEKRQQWWENKGATPKDAAIAARRELKSFVSDPEDQPSIRAPEKPFNELAQAAIDESRKDPMWSTIKGSGYTAAGGVYGMLDAVNRTLNITDLKTLYKYAPDMLMADSAEEKADVARVVAWEAKARRDAFSKIADDNKAWGEALMADVAKQHFKDADSKAEWMLYQALANTPSLAISLGSIFSPTAAPLLLGTMGVMEGGGHYRELRKQNVDHGTAALAGLTVGTLATLIERAVPVELGQQVLKMAKAMPPVAKAEIGKRIARGLGFGTAGIVAVGAGEGTEEVGTGIGKRATDQIVAASLIARGKDPGKVGEKELLDLTEMTDEFMGGVAGGMAMGTGVGVKAGYDASRPTPSAAEELAGALDRSKFPALDPAAVASQFGGVDYIPLAPRKEKDEPPPIIDYQAAADRVFKGEQGVTLPAAGEDRIPDMPVLTPAQQAALDADIAAHDRVYAGSQDVATSTEGEPGARLIDTLQRPPELAVGTQPGTPAVSGGGLLSQATGGEGQTTQLREGGAAPSSTVDTQTTGAPVLSDDGRLAPATITSDGQPAQLQGTSTTPTLAVGTQTAGTPELSAGDQRAQAPIVSDEQGAQLQDTTTTPVVPVVSQPEDEPELDPETRRVLTQRLTDLDIIIELGDPTPEVVYERKVIADTLAQNPSTAETIRATVPPITPTRAPRASDLVSNITNPNVGLDQAIASTQAAVADTEVDLRARIRTTIDLLRDDDVLDMPDMGKVRIRKTATDLRMTTLDEGADLETSLVASILANPSGFTVVERDGQTTKVALDVQQQKAEVRDAEMAAESLAATGADLRGGMGVAGATSAVSGAGLGVAPGGVAPSGGQVGSVGRARVADTAVISGVTPSTRAEIADAEWDAAMRETGGTPSVSGLSQDDYAVHLEHNGLPEGVSAYDALTASPELRGLTAQQRVDLFNANRPQINAFRGRVESLWQSLRNKAESGIKAIGASSGWTNFEINTDTHAKGADRHKSYASLRDFISISEAEMASFLTAMRDAGFNGQVKFPGVGARALLGFDNIVMHGATEADAKLGESIARQVFGDRVTGTQFGTDSSGQSHTQILADRVEQNIKNGTPTVVNQTVTGEPYAIQEQGADEGVLGAEATQPQVEVGLPEVGGAYAEGAAVAGGQAQPAQVTQLGASPISNTVVTEFQTAVAGALPPGATPDQMQLGTWQALPETNDIGMNREEGRMISEVVKAVTGRQVVFFSGPLENQGAFLPSQAKTLFVNANRTFTNPLATLGHEWLHSLRNTAPDIYAKLRDTIMGQSPDMVAMYRDYYGHIPTMKDKTDAEIQAWLAEGNNQARLEEELLADLTGNRFKDVEFWTRFFADVDRTQGKGQALKIADKLLAMLRKLKAALKGEAYAADAFIKDIEEVEGAIKTALREYRATMAGAETAAPAAPQTAPAAAAPKGRLKPMTDSRIEGHADLLRTLAGETGWAQDGGKLLRDADYNVIGRTKWIPQAAWFPHIPQADRLQGRAAREAVEKAIAGLPMPVKEQRFVGHLLNIADEEGVERESWQPEGMAAQDDAQADFDAAQAEAQADFDAEQEAARRAFFAAFDDAERAYGERGAEEDLDRSAAQAEFDAAQEEARENFDAAMAEARAEFELSGQTEEEIRADERAQTAAEQATAKQQRELDAKERKEQNARDEAATQKRLSEQPFEFGVGGKEAKTVQRSIFDQPAPKTVAEMSPADLLRAAADKLEGKSTAEGAEGAMFSTPRGAEIEVDGVMRPALNSNGKPIHPTQEGARNFWRWFGDSKVVDAQGRPLVVYHGTDKDFTAFDAEKRGSTDHGWYGLGAGYFTPNKDSSSSYAIWRDMDSGFGFGPLRDGSKNAGAQVMPAFLSIKNPYVWPDGRAAAKTKAEAQAITDELTAAGYDGVLVPNKYADGIEQQMYEIVAFDPTQIKSAIGNRGTFDGSDANILFSTPRGVAEFYSPLAKAVESAKQGAMPAAQWTAWLQANKGKIGLKDDELQWSGVLDYLGLQGKEKVSKADVLTYLDGNGVQVKPVVLGDEGDWVVFDGEGNNYFYTRQEAVEWAKDMGYSTDADTVFQEKKASDKSTKFSGHRLPGGEDYREVLLTLPERHAYPKAKPLSRAEQDRYAALTQKMRREGNLPADEMREFGALREKSRAHEDELNALEAAGKNRDPFRSPHWFGIDDVIAHMRVDTVQGADGQRYLRVIEIQSDWGQGLKKYDKEIPRFENQMFDKYGAGWVASMSTVEDNHYKTLIRMRKPAPFVTDTRAWTALVVKRALMMAVQEGHDGIVFATGQQNADLYDLSQTIDYIEYSSPDSQGKYYVEAVAKKGEHFMGLTYTLSQLEDHVGKDVAQKIERGEGEALGYGIKKLSGLDLKVGGEGMRTFYDQIVPSVTKDVLKKLGAGDVRVTQNQGGTEQPGFLIPDTMRDTVAGGMPLFSTPRGPAYDQTQSPSHHYASTPESVRVNALAKLKNLEKKRDAGKITEAEYRLGVQEIIKGIEKRNDARVERRMASGRRRGADWVIAQLRRGVADGTVPRDEADFAEWLLDQNPNLAADLGISITQKDGEGSAGRYISPARILKLFSGGLGDGTVVHEVLHHTERMMPEEVQEGVFNEWALARNEVYKQASPEQKKALDDMLAASLGDETAWQRVQKAFADDVIAYYPHYQLASPSEFWAVNATRILSGRFEARGSWVKRAVAWFKEFVQRVKGLLNLPSDAPILKAMEAVMRGDGAFVTPRMLAEGVEVHPDIPREGGKRDEYTTDLFGDAIPGAGGTVTPAASKRRATRPLSRDDAAGAYATRTEVVKENIRELGTNKVTTTERAAQAMAYLARSAVERFDALITDKNGKPLAIVGAHKGALAQASVYPATVVAEAFRINGAANIWFAHNHPSGLAELSRADRQMHGVLIEAFWGSEITPRGLFAIAGQEGAGRKWTFEPVGSRLARDPDVYGITTAPAQAVKVPVVERVYAQEDKLGPPLASPDEAKQAAGVLSGGQPGVLLMTTQNVPIAFVPVNPAEVGALRQGGRMDALYRALSVSNAGAAIIVNPSGVMDYAEVTNLAGLFNSVDTRVLDVIDPNHTGQTWAEQGKHLGGTAFFSTPRGEAETAAQDADDLLAQKFAQAAAGMQDGAVYTQIEQAIKAGQADFELAKRGVVPHETTDARADALARKLGWSIEDISKVLHGGAVEIDGQWMQPADILAAANAIARVNTANLLESASVDDFVRRMAEIQNLLINTRAGYSEVARALGHLGWLQRQASTISDEVDERQDVIAADTKAAASEKKAVEAQEAADAKLEEISKKDGGATKTVLEAEGMVATADVYDAEADAAIAQSDAMNADADAKDAAGDASDQEATRLEIKADEAKAVGDLNKAKSLQDSAEMARAEAESDRADAENARELAKGAKDQAAKLRKEAVKLRTEAKNKLKAAQKLLDKAKLKQQDADAWMADAKRLRERAKVAREAAAADKKEAVKLREQARRLLAKSNKDITKARLSAASANAKIKKLRYSITEARLKEALGGDKGVAELLAELKKQGQNIDLDALVKMFQGMAGSQLKAIKREEARNGGNLSKAIDFVNRTIGGSLAELFKAFILTKLATHTLNTMSTWLHRGVEMRVVKLLAEAMPGGAGMKQHLQVLHGLTGVTADAMAIAKFAFHDEYVHKQMIDLVKMTPRQQQMAMALTKNKWLDQSERFIPNKLGGRIIRRIGFMPLGMEDAFMKVLPYRYSLAMQEASGRPIDYTEAVEYAELTAFQSHVDGLAQVVQRAVHAVPILGILVPFTTTLANLVVQGLSYTPGIGLVPLALAQKRLETARVEGDTLLEQRYTDYRNQAIGRVLVGGIIAVAYMASAAGGGDDDEPLISGLQPVNRFMRAIWRQENGSIAARIGDQILSFERFDPFATSWGLMHAMAEAYKAEDAGGATKAIAEGAYHMVFDKYFMADVGELIMSVREQRFLNQGQRWLTNVMASMTVPGFIAQFPETADKYQRDTTASKDFWDMYTSMVKAKTPFMREEVAPRLDVYGVPLENPAFRNPTPIRPVTARDDPLNDWLLKLNRGLDPNPKSLQGLPTEEKSRLLAKRHDILTRAMDTYEGKGLTREQKRTLVKNRLRGWTQNYVNPARRRAGIVVEKAEDADVVD